MLFKKMYLLLFIIASSISIAQADTTLAKLAKAKVWANALPHYINQLEKQYIASAESLAQKQALFAAIEETFDSTSAEQVKIKEDLEAAQKEYAAIIEQINKLFVFIKV